MTNTNFAVFGWFSSFASDQNTGEGEGLLIRGGLAVGEWIFNAQFFSALVFFFCTKEKRPTVRVVAVIYTEPSHSQNQGDRAGIRYLNTQGSRETKR